MKEYMLVYKGGDPSWRAKATKDELAAVMEKWGAWMGGLQKTDQLVSGGSPLHPTGKRMTGGGDVVTDINATELKELVTGYSIIRARNIEDALVIAKRCPIHRMKDAIVEVREVMPLG